MVENANIAIQAMYRSLSISLKLKSKYCHNQVMLLFSISYKPDIQIFNVILMDEANMAIQVINE